MREIIQKIKLYNFNELDEEIQKKLIEKEAENMLTEYCELWLTSDIESLAKEMLQEAFGNSATLIDVLYSLNYCQGDGAMMEFDLKYNDKDLEIKHNGGRYYHARSFWITGEIEEKQEEELIEKIVAINKKLEREGYKYIDAARNEEDARENLASWEYYSDGKQFDKMEV